SQVALAQVDLATTQPIHVPEVKSTAWTQEDVSKVIPTDISVSSDSGYVATRIGDHAIQNWLNSPEIRNSKLGRTADMVQETMKTEMTVAGDDVDETQHKFTFQVLALQAISQLK